MESPSPEPRPAYPSPSPPREPSAPVQPRIQDPSPWALPIPLTRVLERQQFPPILMAVAALAIGFVLFQLVVPTVGVLIRFLVEGVPADDVEGALTAMMEDVPFMLLLNTVGQWLGLALLAWGLAKFHTPRAFGFLRLRRTDAPLIGLSVLGLVLLTPFVLWLGEINQALPQPEWLEELERSMMELIEGIVGDRSRLLPNLLMIALTPAICEEVMFRGYMQRQVERSLGPLAAVLIIGVIFGLFHLRLTQALPLSVLGIYLAYLTWRTQSLWPAVLVHLVNNGGAVIYAAFVSTDAEPVIGAEGTMGVPWYVGLGALLLFLGFLRVFEARAEAVGLPRQASDETPRATPAGPLPPTAPPTPSPDPTRSSP